MNQFTKSALITLGVNAGLLFLSTVLSPIFFLFMFIGIIGEVLIGLLMLFTKGEKGTGGGMVIVGGVSLLIGLSICSSMTYMH